MTTGYCESRFGTGSREVCFDEVGYSMLPPPLTPGDRQRYEYVVCLRRLSLPQSYYTRLIRNN